MNALLTLGIIACAFVVMVVITVIIENLDRIEEWLFDVSTAYYKFKQRRKKKWH